MTLPPIPRCENRKPYCRQGGQAMKCVSEDDRSWAFVCMGCQQMRVITKPDFRAKMRQQVIERRINPEPYQKRVF